MFVGWVHGRWALIKSTVQQQNLGNVLLQATKKADTDSNFIKSVWTSSHIGWTSLDAIGDSRGILLWSKPNFSIKKVIQAHFFVPIHVFIADAFSFWLLAIFMGIPEMNSVIIFSTSCMT